MRFGLHLPIAGFAGQRPAASTIIECAEAAEDLGYTRLCANDHLIFAVPWVDGLVALAAAAVRTRRIGLMTTASLLVVRGPAAVASAAVALDHVSAHRFTICLTPGSTVADYQAVDIPFEERWRRFDLGLSAFKSFLDREGVSLPVWVASWGSEAGLRRVARHGDGWLASAYHCTPAHFSHGLRFLHGELKKVGKEPESFANAVATTYMHLTDDPEEAAAVLKMLVSPRQAPSDLRDRSLIGTAEVCIEKLRRLEEAGVEEVFVWPIRDEPRQARRFAEQVAPAFMT